jgi:ribosome maturation factor RimP
MLTMQQKKIAHLLAPVAKDLGLDYVGCEFIASSHQQLLRIFIDRTENGVTIDNCTKASRAFSAVLDVEDVISTSYRLEVSSPGLNRPIFTPEQMRASIGRNVKLKLALPREGQRHFKGQLITVEDNILELQSHGEHVKIPFSQLAKANIIPDAPTRGKKQ